MAVTLTSSVLKLMLAHARRAHPMECCGLLTGAAPDRIDTALPARNIAPDPARHFEIDPQALIDAHRAERQGGLQLLGYYHSHPTGLAQPSATDRAQASGDGRLWAIIGGSEVTLWRDRGERFQRLPYEVVDG
jgi:proteasome lid subunit RPN8/RPN11